MCGNNISGTLFIWCKWNMSILTIWTNIKRSSLKLEWLKQLFYYPLMCTRPQIITLLPLLGRTPACAFAHLNSQKVHVRPHVCILDCPTPTKHSSNTPQSMFTIWTSTNIRLGYMPTFQNPSLAGPPWVPVRLVWPLPIRLTDQLVALSLKGGSS